MKNFSIRLPDEQRELLSKIARAHGVKDSDLIRRAVAKFIKSERRRKASAV